MHHPQVYAARVADSGGSSPASAAARGRLALGWAGGGRKEQWSGSAPMHHIEFFFTIMEDALGGWWCICPLHQVIFDRSCKFHHDVLSLRPPISHKICKLVGGLQLRGAASRGRLWRASTSQPLASCCARGATWQGSWKLRYLVALAEAAESRL